MGGGYLLSKSRPCPFPLGPQESSGAGPLNMGPIDLESFAWGELTIRSLQPPGCICAVLEFHLNCNYPRDLRKHGAPELFEPFMCSRTDRASVLAGDWRSADDFSNGSADKKKGSIGQARMALNMLEKPSPMSCNGGLTCITDDRTGTPPAGPAPMQSGLRHASPPFNLRRYVSPCHGIAPFESSQRRSTAPNEGSKLNESQGWRNIVFPCLKHRASSASSCGEGQIRNAKRVEFKRGIPTREARDSEHTPLFYTEKKFPESRDTPGDNERNLDVVYELYFDADIPELSHLFTFIHSTPDSESASITGMFFEPTLSQETSQAINFESIASANEHDSIFTPSKPRIRAKRRLNPEIPPLRLRPKRMREIIALKEATQRFAELIPNVFDTIKVHTSKSSRSKNLVFSMVANEKEREHEVQYSSQ
ncbi:hypothetical protein B0H14DRAFT_2556097 [Mycena olivaceomarginata]|nr:hypothetical protein B0H14DRAFT_2556097 [Mycena olivaceomarginata]